MFDRYNHSVIMILDNFSIAYKSLVVNGGVEKMIHGELVTVEEAAKILKVRRETIRRYIKSGHLRALTLPGGDYRLREKDVQRLLRRPVQEKGQG
jgi:excisionase family DNA binding protein